MKPTIFRAPRNQPIHGFTLIELLVVVAIISVLVAILLPALQETREKARQLVCLSNCRQQGWALQQYVNAYNGFMPSMTEEHVGSDTYDYVFWFTHLADQLAYAIPETNRHHTLPQIFVCPSQTAQARQWAEEGAYLNYQFGWYYIGYIANYDVFPTYWADPCNLKLDHIDQPSTVCPVGEAVDWPVGMGFIWASYVDGRLSLNRHHNSSNYLFCDGHAELQALDMTNPSDYDRMFKP